MLTSYLIKDFRKNLLDWFDTHGRYDLPWKHADNVQQRLYYTWLSEIMLQQTQVITVIPYFLRFIQRFPTVYDLATASVDDVLILWSGLGYYARARNLYHSAVTIKSQYQGQIPTDMPTLISLKGIGRSTAAAILSQALNEPQAILDGNVKRVLSRVVLNDAVGVTLEKTLWPVAQALQSPTRSADYTQAIMDLGATVCKRRPICVECPVQTHCQAYKQGVIDQFPRKISRQPKPQKSAYFLIIRCGLEIVLVQRPSTGIWGGLWCLPQKDMSLEAPIDWKSFFEIQGIIPIETQSLSSFHHDFTHYRLWLFPVVITFDQLIDVDKLNLDKDNISQKAQWVTIEQALEYALPKPMTTLLKQF